MSPFLVSMQLLSEVDAMNRSTETTYNEEFGTKIER